MINRINEMSERGSFVTEYIYCEKCFDILKELLLGNDKFLCSQQVLSWEKDEFLPIIAGKIGGLFSNDEIFTFETEFIPDIEDRICHNIRIAVLADVGSRIFFIKPQKIP